MFRRCWKKPKNNQKKEDEIQNKYDSYRNEEVDFSFNHDSNGKNNFKSSSKNTAPRDENDREKMAINNYNESDVQSTPPTVTHDEIEFDLDDEGHVILNCPELQNRDLFISKITPGNESIYSSNKYLTQYNYHQENSSQNILANSNQRNKIEAEDFSQEDISFDIPESSIINENNFAKLYHSAEIRKDDLHHVVMPHQNCEDNDVTNHELMRIEEVEEVQNSEKSFQGLPIIEEKKKNDKEISYEFDFENNNNTEENPPSNKFSNESVNSKKNSQLLSISTIDSAFKQSNLKFDKTNQQSNIDVLILGNNSLANIIHDKINYLGRVKALIYSQEIMDTCFMHDKTIKCAIITEFTDEFKKCFAYIAKSEIPFVVILSNHKKIIVQLHRGELPKLKKICYDEMIINEPPKFYCNSSFDWSHHKKFYSKAEYYKKKNEMINNILGCIISLEFGTKSSIKSAQHKDAKKILFFDFSNINEQMEKNKSITFHAQNWDPPLIHAHKLIDNHTVKLKNDTSFSLELLMECSEDQPNERKNVLKIIIKKKLLRSYLFFGIANLGLTCYVNTSLQAIKRMKKIWNKVDEEQIDPVFKTFLWEDQNENNSKKLVKTVISGCGDSDRQGIGYTGDMVKVVSNFLNNLRQKNIINGEDFTIQIQYEYKCCNDDCGGKDPGTDKTIFVTPNYKTYSPKLDSTTMNSYWSLNKKLKSLSEFINEFLAEEEEFECFKCSSAYKKNFIKSMLPTYLFVNVKDFAGEIESRIIVKNPENKSGVGSWYQLVGVAIYTGFHYYFIAKNITNDKFICLNDEHCKPDLSLDKVNSYQNKFVALYEKID